MAKAESSRTAVFVCQGRAVAHERLAAGRFYDPTALPLLRDSERASVEHARASTPPKSWTARIDHALLGRQAQSVAVRTVAIDEAIRTAANPQLVILGAGLDGRAWRMPELANVTTFEVDHPASQHDKRARAAALGPATGPLNFVPADFAHASLGPALATGDHQESLPTTWILEGVVPYLTPQDAAATVQAITDRSAPGSQLIVSYQTASSGAATGRLLARGLLVLSGRRDPMAHEPRRSSWTPSSMNALLTNTGVDVVRDISLVELARDLSVPSKGLRTSRLSVAATSAR